MHPNFSSNPHRRDQVRQQRHVDIQRLWRRLAGTPQGFVGNPANAIAPPQCGTLQVRAAGSGNEDGSGDVSWGDPTLISAAEASAAHCLLPSLGGMSSRLISNTHGFDIPDAAVIGGIYVRIWRSRDVHAPVMDESVWLTKDGVTGVGAPRWSDEIWPVTEAFAVYGDAGDLWEASWTADEINAPTFGAMVRVQSPSGSAFVTAYVDMIEISVCYAVS